MTHAVTAFDGNTQHVAYIFRIFHLAESGFQRIQCRCNTGSCIIYLMGNHADHLFIGFLFSLKDFLRQYFHQIERVMESPVDKRGMRTFIYIGIVQANSLRFIQGNTRQLHRQRGIYLCKGFSGEIDRQRLSEHLAGSGIQRYDLVIQIQHNHSHRRSIDQQIQEMILFPQVQTFVFQLFHHLIENVHDAVGLLLPDTAQAGTEVLLFQQFHTITDYIQRLDDTTVKKEKVQDRNQDNTFHNKEHEGRIIIEDMVNDNCQNSQQQPGQDPEQSFYPHSNIIYLSVGIPYFSNRRYKAARLIPNADATCERFPSCVSKA